MIGIDGCSSFQAYDIASYSGDELKEQKSENNDMAIVIKSEISEKADATFT
jgi:hypothetical protein